jgi:hypothetical protein
MATSSSICLQDEVSIPLLRLKSSKYTPLGSKESLPLWKDSSTGKSLVQEPSNAPASILQIQSPGKSPLSCPNYPKQLTVPIFSTNNSSTDLPATTPPTYISIRDKRSSGSCRLVLTEDESQSTIATTTYQFGPRKSPVVKFGDGEGFQFVRKGLWTRRCGFERKGWEAFEWRYGSRSERKSVSGDFNGLLILEKIVSDQSEAPNGRVLVARLIRGEEMRTPGTSSWTAGNGGRLEIFTEDKEEEVMVVCTCLVMLKKEIDRLRGRQMMAMGGNTMGLLISFLRDCYSG